jgi:subtilisin
LEFKYTKFQIIHMKKIITVSLILLLAMPVVLAFPNQARPYIIYSENPILKKLLGVRHEFPGKFTTDLTPAQVEIFKRVVRIEPVKLYHIIGKPICGDGVAHPSEQCGEPGLPDCPEGQVCVDCKCVTPEERSCYPSDQTPWGIEKIYNDTTITTTSGGAGIDVAVLDTGVYKDHPDLTRRVADCKDFTKKGVKPGCADGNGHGTHVSGTILADGGSDGLGIYGVAPEANLFAYKVCNNAGLCWADDIAAAIRYATDNGVEIISMSLGGDTSSDLIYDAVKYAYDKGVLIVAAAGNDGPELGSIDYPAAYVEVIAVGAIDVNEDVPDWSSRGINDGDYTIEEREVEFGAPGVSVESTWNDGCYYVASGTSMATPHVSGLAAKLWQGSASETRTYLQERAKLYDLWTSGDDSATGFGLPTVG